MTSTSKPAPGSRTNAFKAAFQVGAQTEQERNAAMVAREVQMLYFLSVIPHAMFTFAMILLIPAAWFHTAMALSGDTVAVGMSAWLIGIPCAWFAGRIVPTVPISTLTTVLAGHMDAGNPRAGQFSYLATAAARLEQEEKAALVSRA